MDLNNLIIKRLDNETVKDMKKINSIVLPITYVNQLYEQMLKFPFSFVAYVKENGIEVPIGSIGCVVRKEPIINYEIGVCVVAIAVLAKYRSKGIGSMLLGKTLEEAELRSLEFQCSQVFLHVQTSNEEAIKFYEKFNFTTLTKIENYYKRLTPSDCYILTRSVTNKLSN